MEDVSYEGVENSFEYLQKKIQNALEVYGRFDGFLGFSQGAVCSLLVTMTHVVVSSSILLSPKSLQGSIQLPAPPKFLVVIAGFIPRDVWNRPWAYNLSPLELPSLHITGSKDPIHDPPSDDVDWCGKGSLATAKRYFKDAVVLTHSQGHAVPKLSRESPELTSNIRDFFERMRATASASYN